MIGTPVLLIATNNPGKLREIKTILKEADLPLEVITPSELRIDLAVEETGDNYLTNAKLKAQAFAQHSGMPALADDSGLEVDVLGGQPGIRSARFSPLLKATDAHRRAYLLEQLGAHPRPWKARFYCQVAIALPDGEVQYAEGECRGEIIPEERGSGGFGYDPIFLLPDLGMTMAELPMEIKNRVSHRGRAVRAALPLLERLLPF